MFDSYVNLLRSQTESMSAALANVDSIVVTPFDKCYETPNDFSERLARNQQQYNPNDQSQDLVTIQRRQN